MRKYTSPTQKAQMYSQKYGLREEEAYRIVTSSDDVLTLEELKIKYDDENLDDGKLPDGISFNEFDLIIWNTVHKMYDYRYSWWISKEDLHGDTYLYLWKRKKLFNSCKQLKTAAVNYIKSALDQKMWREAHIGPSLNAVVSLKEDSNGTSLSDIVDIRRNTDSDESDILMTIMSIKDKSIRNFLIVSGYLICNISSFRREYLNILRESDKEVKNNLINISQDIVKNDEILRDTIDGKPNENHRKAITAAKIIAAMKLNVDEAISADKKGIISEMRYYLQNACGLF